MWRENIMEKEFNINLERKDWVSNLRVVATVAVVVLHISVPYLENKFVDLPGINWWGGNLFDSLTRFCVPVFLMITGTLLLPQKTYFNVFFKKRTKRLLPPFLFWSIAVGIVLAAGLLPVAVFGSVLIGVMLTLFSSKKPGDSPYILMINCENREAEAKIREMIKASVKRTALKSKSVSNGNIELNFEAFSPERRG